MLDPAIQQITLRYRGDDGVGDTGRFLSLVSGRDPLTGQALTPQEMFVTWLAFSIPLVSAGMLRGFTDDAAEMIADTRYRIKYHYGLPAGVGETDTMGNIWISPHGERIDRLRALYHEQVHAYLLKHPVLRPISLHGYRISQLYRYTEEAIAEGRAQLLTGGHLREALTLPFHPTYQITPTGLLGEAGLVGVFSYSSYLLWSELTSCDPSGAC